MKYKIEDMELDIEEAANVDICQFGGSDDECVKWIYVIKDDKYNELSICLGCIR